MQTSSRPVYLPGPGMHHLPNARSPHVVNPVPQPSIGDSKQPLPSAWCLQALQVPHHTDGAHARDQSATTPAVSIKNGHPVVVIQRNAQYRRICRGARSVAIAGTVGKGRQVIASTLPCCADEPSTHNGRTRSNQVRAYPVCPPRGHCHLVDDGFWIICRRCLKPSAGTTGAALATRAAGAAGAAIGGKAGAAGGAGATSLAGRGETGASGAAGATGAARTPVAATHAARAGAAASAGAAGAAGPAGAAREGG